MSAASDAIKFLRDKCGFGCGDPGSEISLAWKAIEDQSAAYEALVAGCSELAAKLDRQAAENYTDRGNALSRCADDIRLLLVREGGDAT